MMNYFVILLSRVFSPHPPPPPVSSMIEMVTTSTMIESHAKTKFGRAKVNNKLPASLIRPQFRLETTDTRKATRSLQVQTTNYKILNRAFRKNWC